MSKQSAKKKSVNSIEEDAQEVSLSVKRGECTNAHVHNITGACFQETDIGKV